MDLAGYVVNAVLVEGRSVAQVAADHGVSRSWLYELLARYRADGEEGLRPQSRRPRSSPTRVGAEMEEEIVALRKSLAEEGLDAGASTIHYHLQWRYRRRKRAVPSVATIWRVLSGGASSPPSPTSALAAPGGDSRRSCPTSAGRLTPPNGPGRRLRRGDPERPRRPLLAAGRLPSLWNHQSRRRGGHVPPGGGKPRVPASM
ncbi:MAG: helix-turn-helix domain-containing protein [Acidimicrobiales bacterium]